jgi:dynein heavy chain 1
VRGINEAIRNVKELSAEELVRLWAHEALRLFHDRLDNKLKFSDKFFYEKF